ncbi:MAG: hydroxypyruvate isomerase [Betaproteobacteria bacterium RIFCSPLOWO2_12_FULL_62_13b]|nr:MAG: hydroxypyruvate isomerase [Betaproteobacteria bacterium RIFCSPLOWO2_12_FULL_62_13b]
MPKFCANLSMLFGDVGFPNRFDRAAGAGFRAVEFQFPYAHGKDELSERARRGGVEVVLFNLPAGNWEKGERGIACIPSRVSEFRDGVGRAIEYAKALGCARVNCLSGIAPARVPAETLREVFVSNLRFAAGELEREGITLLIEPVNTRSVPGFYLRNSGQALALMDEARSENLKLQYDVFHMQIMEGDLAATIEAAIARIGHIQIADVPDRHEPGTGEINYPFLFDRIDRVGYQGWIGCEYAPAGRTEDGLGWLRPYLEQAGTEARIKHDEGGDEQ